MYFLDDDGHFNDSTANHTEHKGGGGGSSSARAIAIIVVPTVVACLLLMCIIILLAVAVGASARSLDKIVYYARDACDRIRDSRCCSVLIACIPCFSRWTSRHTALKTSAPSGDTPLYSPTDTLFDDSDTNPFAQAGEQQNGHANGDAGIELHTLTPPTPAAVAVLPASALNGHTRSLSVVADAHGHDD